MGKHNADDNSEKYYSRIEKRAARKGTWGIVAAIVAFSLLCGLVAVVWGLAC